MRTLLRIFSVVVGSLIFIPIIISGSAKIGTSIGIIGLLTVIAGIIFIIGGSTAMSMNRRDKEIAKIVHASQRLADQANGVTNPENSTNAIETKEAEQQEKDFTTYAILFVLGLAAFIGYLAYIN